MREPGYLMNHHPLRSGMLKYDTYLKLHCAGTGVESQTSMACLLAHLYAACKLLYPEDPAWPDMEVLLERQDKNRLFFGGLPKTFKEASRKMVLASGGSATNFARGNRNKDPIMNLDNAQLFQDRSVLGKLYQERMYKEPSTSEATELTRKLIQPMKSSPRAAARAPGAAKTNVSTSSVRHRDWRPLGILEELQEWLLEDAMDLYWDWFCMNQICGEIWTKIKAVFSQNPESSAHGEREENPNRCPELTVVRNIIQDTIQTRATPPNRPVGWIGDRCIRRLLHVSPEDRTPRTSTATGRGRRCEGAGW
jgi:hypothetical protein